MAGRIYPSTSSNVELVATLASGRQIRGETRISRSQQPIARIRTEPAGVKPCKETLDAIAKADLITIGPGSLYTSLIPHLLVDGIPKAIRASRAVKVYFANLMTQPGETSGMSASAHLRALLQHAGKSAQRLIDVCVLNAAGLPASVVTEYGKRSARPVEMDVEAIEKMGIEVRTHDLVGALRRMPGDKIRHHPTAIGAIAMEAAQQERLRRQRKRAS